MITLEQFERHRPLHSLTTLGIGGPAQYYFEARTIKDMQEALRCCRKHHLPFFILGKGSNLLIDDRGVEGVVIANRIDFNEKPEPTLWHVGAGYSFSLLGTQTTREGLSGLEFAAGIPGSVGGAVYMNAGANGSDTATPLVSVDFVSAEGELLSIPKEELAFSYRSSTFQQLPGAIVGATFRLAPSTDARQKQLTLIEYRRKTQPYNAKSAGCVFRNPTCGHAGALIEQSGLKGQGIGDAQVSTLHANFLINAGNASAEDFKKLIRFVQQKIKQQHGVELETEIRFIPYSLTEESHDGQ